MVAASKPVTPNSSSPDLGTRLWTQDLGREHGFEPLVVEGTLPPELRGTLYRNGPGLFGQRGVRYSHPFEADGAVTAIRIEHGKAFGASRVTESEGLREERAAGKLLYGLKAPWWRRVRSALSGKGKNTANTNVMMWQGRLYALMEAALPTELDPNDLAFRGATSLGDTIAGWFSAHPHRVHAREAFYNFGVEVGRKPKLHAYELPDVGPAKRIGTIDLGCTPMLHDFIATETHLVWFVSPVRVNLPRMVLQIGGFGDLFKWKPELGTEVICMPIDRPSEVVRFTTEAFYQWHFTNAFTRNGELVIDYVRYPSFDSFYDIGAFANGATPAALDDSQAHRATIDLVAKTLRSEVVLDRACEFPTVAPGFEGREHGRSYLVLDELRGIGAVDAKTGALVEHRLPDTQRISEPLFVARPGTATDDSGWLVALAHDGPTDRAFLAVYDAARIPDGPVARAWFDHQVPITFHGTFAAR